MNGINSLQDYLESRDKSTYLPMDKLIDNGLYHIHARNSSIGVYDAGRKGFWIFRYKFGYEFIFLEYHWDSSDHGTVKPLEFIEACSIPTDRWKVAVENCVDPELVNFLKRLS